MKKLLLALVAPLVLGGLPAEAGTYLDRWNNLISTMESSPRWSSNYCQTYKQLNQLWHEMDSKGVYLETKDGSRAEWDREGDISGRKVETCISKGILQGAPQVAQNQSSSGGGHPWPTSPGRCPYGTMIRHGQSDWMDYNCDGRVNVEDLKYQQGLMILHGPSAIYN